MSLRLTGNRLGQVVVPTAAGVLATGTGAAGLWITASTLGVAAVVSRRVTSPPPDPLQHLPANERKPMSDFVPPPTFTTSAVRP
jgi:hypothetical protein